MFGETTIALAGQFLFLALLHNTDIASFKYQ